MGQQLGTEPASLTYKTLHCGATQNKKAAHSLPESGFTGIKSRSLAVPTTLRGVLNPVFFEVYTMSRVCQVTGVGPAVGNNVSHSNIKSKRRFLPNLHYHRFWVESEKRFIRLRVSAKGMRIIDKKGIDAVLTEIRGRGVKV